MSPSHMQYPPVIDSCLCFRVYLGYHTYSQVVWGGLVGTVLGCLWFAVVQIVLTPFFPYIAAR